MTNVKLHINISQGIIDAEGDQDFVWRVYEDFRDKLSAVTPAAPMQNHAVVEEASDEGESAETGVGGQKPKRRSQKRRQNGQTSGSSKEKHVGITAHRPRIISSLDTSGIKEFLAQYKLASNTDRIVAMTRFLEGKNIIPASFDAYYTLFNDAGLKTPEAFGQAFVDARTKGFIGFTTTEDVTLPIRGKNHIDHGGIKKADA